MLISHCPSDTQTHLELLAYRSLSTCSCCVVCKGGDDDLQSYQALAQQYPMVTFLNESTDKRHRSLSDTLADYLNRLEQNHLFVIDDACEIECLREFGAFSIYAHDMRDTMDEYIDQLESTYAYAFYGGLTIGDFAQYKDQPYAQRPCELLDGGVGVWQFKCHTPLRWREYNVAPVLYRVKDVMELLKKIRADSVDQLLDQWKKSAVAPEKVGLFFCGV